MRVEWCAAAEYIQHSNSRDPMEIEVTRCIRTLRLKVKSEAYSWLNTAAIEVNQSSLLKESLVSNLIISARIRFVRSGGLRSRWHGLTFAWRIIAASYNLGQASPWGNARESKKGGSMNYTKAWCLLGLLSLGG